MRHLSRSPQIACLLLVTLLAGYLPPAAQAAPGDNELIRQINHGGLKLDRAIALLPAKTTRFCRMDSESEDLLVTLENISKGIGQLDAANETFKGLKDFVAASSVFADVSKIRNKLVLECLNSVNKAKLIAALKELQAVLKSIRVDLDKLWFEAKKVGPALAQEYPAGALAPNAALAYPAPMPKPGATSCDNADLVCENKPVLERDRALKIWDQILTHESTLNRLEHAPADYDEARGAWRIFNSMGDAESKKFGAELKEAEDLLAEAKLEFKYTVQTSPDELQAKLERFEESLKTIQSHLQAAGKIWADFTGNHVVAEAIGTGASYIAVGSGIFLVVAGTVLTGGALGGVIGGGSAAGGATGMAGWAFSAGGTASLFGTPVVLNRHPAPPKPGSEGTAGDIAVPKNAPIEVAVEIEPEKPQPPAPATPGVLSSDQGIWDASKVKDKEKEKTKPPVTPPAPAPQPKPKPKPPVAVADPAQPRNPVAPVSGNIFGRNSGAHMPRVGGVEDKDKGNEIKCDADAQLVYLEAARKPRPRPPYGLSEVNQLADILMGQQKLYFCRVNAVFADSPQAIFLSRLGLRAASIGQGLNPFTVCGKIHDAEEEQLKDFKILKQVDKSKELRALEADIIVLQNKNCASFVEDALKDRDPPELTQTYADLCAWRQLIEDESKGGRRGITTGFSYLLGNCRLH